MTAGDLSLTPFEVATGAVFGTRAGSLPDPRGQTPLQALEQVILPALTRAPCLVSFSGGRDSSSVLAVATALARREGLPLPVPATNVFDHAPETDETRWQEHVVRHLGLTDWARIPHSAELDLLGGYARELLCRHGLLWPFNIHFHLPLFQLARGGSMLTGIGGDELFRAAQTTRVASVLARRVRPEPRDMLRLGLAAMPPFLRRALMAGRVPVALPWLRPAAQEHLVNVLADSAARVPAGLRRRMEWTWRSRYLAVGTAAFDLAAASHDVQLLHPLLSPSLWAEVARVAQPSGFAGRTEGMRRLFGDVLPDAVCARQGKASFNAVFWTELARRHAESWDGTGVPDEWVDREALAAHWRGDAPMANSFTLLQASWLASADGLQ